MTIRRARTPTRSLCSRFHRASELIGRRWTGAIIFVLLGSPCRFATLRGAIPDITDRMLSERLQELEQEGLVVRTVVPNTPVRVEYGLSRKGRALRPAIEAIARWSHAWEGRGRGRGNGSTPPVTRNRAREAGRLALAGAPRPSHGPALRGSSPGDRAV
jgi:DNA-binding HxlR family transcriptional regulator